MEWGCSRRNCQLRKHCVDELDSTRRQLQSEGWQQGELDAGSSVKANFRRYCGA